MGGMQTGTEKHEVSIVVSTLRPYSWLVESMTWTGGTHRDAELHTSSVEHKKRERRGRKGMQICVPCVPCVPARNCLVGSKLNAQPVKGVIENE